MRSVKPGRGPSLMGGIIGLFMVGIGIVNIIQSAQKDTKGLLFSIFWTGMVIVITVNNFKNATGKNRYSQYDITDANEEPDPLNERFGYARPRKNRVESEFCPYCGTAVADDFEFCNKCGKKLP